MLADKVVELGIVDGISPETIRQTIKNQIKPLLKQHGCLPKAHDAEFASRSVGPKWTGHSPSGTCYWSTIAKRRK